MFNLKVEEVETGKTLIEEKNLTGVVLTFSGPKNCKSSVLTDCKGDDIIVIYASLRYLVNQMREKHEVLKLLDKVGLIDTILSQIDAFIEYDEDEHDVPVIQFPRKCNEKP